MLVVSRTVTVDRSPELVRSQFADVAHHQRAGVHRGTRFRVIDESATECTYEQVTGRGPLGLRQRYHLDRRDAAHQVNTVVAGPFRGGTLRFDIAGSTPGSTVVTATLASPPTVATRLLGPFLRRALGRSLGRALAEDKVDIESGAYERHARPA
jgi:hypothetical protein